MSDFNFDFEELVEFGDKVKKMRNILFEIDDDLPKYFNSEEKESLQKSVNTLIKNFNEFQQQLDNQEKNLFQRVKKMKTPQKYNIDTIFYGDLSKLKEKNV